jgi:HSP20 family protein
MARKKTTARKPAKKAATRKQTKASKKSTAKTTAAKKAATKSKSADAKVQASKDQGPGAAVESRLLTPLAELEMLLERLRKSQWPNPLNWDWPSPPDFGALFEGRLPAIDIVDGDTHIIARAELPGVDKDDLEIQLGDRMLTIKGKTRQEKKKTEGDIHRQEIRAGAFARTLTLPEKVDAKRARATYKDGVLQLKMPKLEKSKKHSVKVR